MALQYATKAHPITTGIDISSLDFWKTSFEERERSFARLRAEAPISWHAPIEVAGFPNDEAGFWAVTRAEDITYVSHHNELFSSALGTSLEPVPLQLQLMFGFFLMMDPPRHSIYRRLVSAAFTPKAIAAITDQIFARAKKIVDSLVGAGDVDFVEACSALLPLQTISDMIGVPPSEQLNFRLAAERFIGTGDETILAPGEDPIAFRLAQYAYLQQLGTSLAAHRRKHPGDDLMTNLVQAEIEGHALSDDDIASFLVLMSVAGNDTTKQTTTRTVMSLAKHPEQRAWLVEDFDGRIGGAVEEFVRHATPIIQFARTATQDTGINGVAINEGDRVAIFYCSGNRDESIFPSPEKFDLSRPRTPHVGFGGGGVHFCLGNNVAKTQLRALFGELLTRLPPIEVGEPDYLVSNFVNGVKHLPAHIG